MIDALRWTGSAAVVLAAYAVIGWFILFRPAPLADQGGGEPAVEIELQPLPAAAPEPPSDLTPGPAQVQPESQAEAASQSPIEQTKPIDPAPVVASETDEKPTSSEKPQGAQPAAVPLRTPETTSNEAVASPSDVDPVADAKEPDQKPVEQIGEAKPRLPDENKVEPVLEPELKPQVVPQVASSPAAEAPPPSAPESIEAPPGPAAPSSPGQTEKLPNRAALTWERLLVSRLERAKRYPAQADGRDGATTVAFTIDRSGRLVASQVVRSSGSSILDAATMDLLGRSQPFPTPPHDIGTKQLSFEVTIRYTR